jgi:hypothetical protein
MPRLRNTGPARAAILAAACLFAAGCSGSPRVAAVKLATARHEVVALVNATGAAIDPPAHYVPVGGADLLPCKKKLLGYSVGDTGAHHAEAPVRVALASGDGAALLGRIEHYWRDRGYRIDRSGMGDKTFPKLRAFVGADYELIATGYVGLPEVNLYGVSACARS